MRAERIELATGVKELKHEKALLLKDVEYWQNRAKAVEPGFFEKLMRSTVVDLALFVLGTWFGIQMAGTAN